MARSSRTQKTLVLIDGNALVHRSFHALPPLTTRDGVMVNAVFGFTSILLKVLADVKPDYVAVAFDKAKKTFRHEKFEAYKAKRLAAPQELYDQIPLIKKIVQAFGFPIYELEGFEADDVIGTIALKNPSVTLVVSGDLDMLQLVDAKTRLLTPKQGVKETMIYDTAAVEERFGGLKPSQMIDYKGLRGDTSDNIPGVKGVGEKGAVSLLRAFGTLEKLYAFLHSVEGMDAKELVAKMTADGLSPEAIKLIKGKTRELLLREEKMALLSKEIATIVREAPVDFDLSACETRHIDRARVMDLLREFGFKSLLVRVPKQEGDALTPEEGQLELTPRAASAQEQQLFSAVSERPEYPIISTSEALQELIKKIVHAGEFAFDTETETLDHVNPVLVGISISLAAGDSYYIPVAHAAGRQIPRDELLGALKPVFEDARIRKIGHNIKYDYVSLLKAGIEAQGLYFDTMIAAYLLTSSSRGLSLKELSLQELGHEMQQITELIGKKDQISFADVAIDAAASYAGDDADVTMRLYNKFAPRLAELKIDHILRDIEVPLIPVLARMERAGITLDVKFMAALSREFGGQIAELEKRIYALAGVKFNINSTQQLSSILFETLKLSREGLKRTKKGTSTAAGELDKLKGTHEIIDQILQYREFEKLRNTYIDALPQLVRKDTGRIHTSYNQTIAATGRLSSTDPNLQNIPIRTDVGRQIRKAFVAEPGRVLLSLDYSQIELRIAAHIAHDDAMQQAFINNEDVHQATAAQIYHVALDAVTPDMRRSAKAINFGILYGMSPYGLSQALAIPREEAQGIIDAYMATHAGIRTYMDEIVEFGTRHGYVETLAGRKRFIPELRAKNFQLQQLGRRMAINTPMQGTQADIIKIAMLAVDKRYGADDGARMLLQVHDELVFEVERARVEEVARECRALMEGAWKLAVPLRVDAKVGENWGEMEGLEL